MIAHVIAAVALVAFFLYLSQNLDQEKHAVLKIFTALVAIIIAFQIPGAADDQLCELVVNETITISNETTTPPGPAHSHARHYFTTKCYNPINGTSTQSLVKTYTRWYYVFIAYLFIWGFVWALDYLRQKGVRIGKK